MAAPSTSNPAGSLTLTPTLASAVTVGQYVYGYVTQDERGRVFNPFANGFAPAASNTPGQWLPKVTIANTPVSGGPVYLTCSWGTSDTVNASSVLSNLQLAPTDYVLVASGTF